MAEEKRKSKYAVKPDCFHYAHRKCKILTSSAKGELNCELCKCSFFETAAEYKARQDKFKARVFAEMKKAGINYQLKKNLD